MSVLVLVSQHILSDICSNSARLFGKSLHVGLDALVKTLPDVIHRPLHISSGDSAACGKPPSPIHPSSEDGLLSLFMFIVGVSACFHSSMSYFQKQGHFSTL